MAQFNPFRLLQVQNIVLDPAGAAPLAFDEISGPVLDLHDKIVFAGVGKAIAVFIVIRRIGLNGSVPVFIMLSGRQPTLIKRNDKIFFIKIVPPINLFCVLDPVNGDVDTRQFGVSKIGSLDGRFMVYRDTFYTTNSALVGFKGVNEWDTGVVYLPYIQLMLSKTTVIITIFMMVLVLGSPMGLQGKTYNHGPDVEDIYQSIRNSALLYGWSESIALESNYLGVDSNSSLGGGLLSFLLNLENIFLG